MDFAAATARLDRSVNALLGAVPVVYTPADGAAVEVDGIFDADQVPVGGGGRPAAVVDWVGPTISLLLADLPGNPEEDEPAIAVAGATYEVKRTLARDAGRIVLGLSRVE